MNAAFYFARRIGAGFQGKNFSGIIRKIAIISITLSLAVMIISMAVVTGFQEEIRGKVIGFGAHIQVSHFDVNYSTELKPISKDQQLIDNIKQVKGVTHVQAFANKAGIIKTDEDIHGIVLKGAGQDFDPSFFNKHLLQGSIPDFSQEDRSDSILISSYMSKQLQISIGDDVWLYFIQDPPRLRRMYISGIYDTGMEELDNLFVIGDIRHVQRLNDWDDNQVGGLEIFLEKQAQTDAVLRALFEFLPYDLEAQSISRLFPQIFDWLALLDMNVVVILTLMLFVANINMITTLLITVLEKTSFIGVLKAMGAPNVMVRKIFLYHAGMMILKGLLLGNLLGISICLLQHHFGVVKLAQESYYVSEVPVNIDALTIIILNAATFLICMALLIIPSMVIARITPVKAINFR